jgi:hypothetical protein
MSLAERISALFAPFCASSMKAPAGPVGEVLALGSADLTGGVGASAPERRRARPVEPPWSPRATLLFIVVASSGAWLAIGLAVKLLLRL